MHLHRDEGQLFSSFTSRRLLTIFGAYSVESSSSDPGIESLGISHPSIPCSSGSEVEWSSSDKKP